MGSRFKLSGSGYRKTTKYASLMEKTTKTNTFFSQASQINQSKVSTYYLALSKTNN